MAFLFKCHKFKVKSSLKNNFNIEICTLLGYYVAYGGRMTTICCSITIRCIISQISSTMWWRPAITHNYNTELQTLSFLLFLLSIFKIFSVSFFLLSNLRHFIKIIMQPILPADMELSRNTDMAWKCPCNYIAACGV
jgi:hypothetical protein